MSKLVQDGMASLIQFVKVPAVMVAMLVGWVMTAHDFTEEEDAAIAELKEAGLLDVEIEKLLDDAYDEYYLEDGDDNGTNDEFIIYDSKDELPDTASDRGGPGPGRRKRPGQHRRRQRPGTKRNLLQLLVSRLLGSGKTNRHHTAGYGPPRPHKHKPAKRKPKKPKKKKRRPSYQKPAPSYNRPYKPASQTADIIAGLDEYEAPKAPSYSPSKPLYKPKPSYRPEPKPHTKVKTRYKTKWSHNLSLKLKSK